MKRHSYFKLRFERGNIDPYTTTNESFCDVFIYNAFEELLIYIISNAFKRSNLVLVGCNQAIINHACKHW